MIAVINMNQNTFASQQLEYFLSVLKIPLFPMFESTDLFDTYPSWDYASNSFLDLIRINNWNEIIFLYDNSNS